MFLPLGFFGQNFGWMTSHVRSLAAFLLLGIGGLLVPCIALYAWFPQGGVIGGRR